MNRSDRMLAIILELQRKGTLRAEDLAERFDVSKRSIYRDIEALSGTGVPVVAVPGRGYSLMEGYFLPPLSFTADEATALMAGGDLIAQNFADDDYGATARTAVEKIAAVLNTRQRQEVQELLECIQFIRTDAAHTASNHGLLRQLRRAIRDRRRIRFHYGAKGEELNWPRYSRRSVDPYMLVHVDGIWYLNGHCHLRNDLRTFRLSRIQELEVTGETFSAPKKRHRLRVERNSGGIEAEVLFAPEAIQWVRERPSYWKVSEEMRPEGLLLRLCAPTEGDLVSWLLTWGSRARVLSPASLMERLAAEAKKICTLYEASPTADMMVATAPP